LNICYYRADVQVLTEFGPLIGSITPPKRDINAPLTNVHSFFIRQSRIKLDYPNDIILQKQRKEENKKERGESARGISPESISRFRLVEM
jgi:hypothetical protein